jgi:para-nitrobenzyl esterase
MPIEEVEAADEGGRTPMIRLPSADQSCQGRRDVRSANRGVPSAFTFAVASIVLGLWTEPTIAQPAATDPTLGVTGVGAAALQALRVFPADKFTQGASAQEEFAALSAGRLIIGFSGSILDGKLVVGIPEAALAARHQAAVPVMIGANNRDLGIGRVDSKDALFVIFGADATEARKLYDPQGNQTLDELKQQVFADETMTEPARHLADQVARAGQPVWLYRFSYVAESQRAKQKGTPTSPSIDEFTSPLTSPAFA